MPIHELPRRRDSWPPTQVHLSKDSTPNQREQLPTTSSIDENPFQFFLTTPEDDEDIDDEIYFSDDYLSDEDLSAGIETPDSASRSPVREVSPSSLQRNPLPLNQYDDEEDKEDYEFGFGLAIPLSLKDFTSSTSTISGRKSRTSTRRNEDEELRGLGISLPDLSSFGRGRARARLVPVRKTRSLSARRKPLSWRAPSPGIWSIREESEEDKDKGEEVYSVSAPCSSRIGEARGILASPRLGEEKKVKKRVHWAL